MNQTGILTTFDCCFQQFICGSSYFTEYWSYAPNEGQLTHSSFLCRNSNDWCFRTVFGNNACSMTSNSRRKDSLSVQIQSGNRNGLADSFCNCSFLCSLLFHEDFTMVQSGFRFLSNAGHCKYGFYWVFTSSSLSGEHDRICSVENSVSYVTRFSTSRTWVALHGIQHLCSCDNWFSSYVTFLNHQFLSQRYIFSRDFNTKVTTSNHQAVRSF